MLKIVDKTNAIWCSSNYGPCFGRGCDLALIYNDSKVSYSCTGTSYEKYSQNKDGYLTSQFILN